MVGIGSAAGAVTSILEFLNKNGYEFDPKQFQDAMKHIGLVRTNGSITKLLSNTVIEPVIIATNTAKDVDPGMFDKLLQLNCDMFCSFYLQAFKILTTHYGQDSSLSLTLLGGGSNLGLESFDVTKQQPNYFETVMNDSKYLRVSTEAIFNRREKAGTSLGMHNTFTNDDIEKNPLHHILHRELEVKITTKLFQYNTNNKTRTPKDGTEHTIVMPLIIKAHVIITNNNGLMTMLAPSSRDKEFSYRLDEYRAGAISLSELIFCTDLIKQYKKNKINDKDKLLDIINSRRLSSTVTAGMLKGIQGYEKNFNMLIVSSDDKVRLDKYIGGDTKNEKYKQELLEKAYALSMTVVDPDYERVIIQVRDIRGDTNVGFKTISKRKDKDNSGLEEMFKSMFMSKPLSF